MKKTVLINGTFNSGSGAINDYLSSRRDFHNPLGDNEFRIVSDPMGLHNLYNSCYSNNRLLSSAYGFTEFLNYVKNLQKYVIYVSPGKKGKIYNSNLIKFTDEFIKSITKLNYYAVPHYTRVNFDLKSKINYSLGLKLNKKIYDLIRTNIIIPKSKEIFIKNSKKYIKQIIEKTTINGLAKENIVLNNAIDALDPIESSKYFINPKIVIVTRDPRDIFSSMKIRKSGAGPNYNVKIFIDWYKHFFGSLHFKKTIKNKKILHIKFENFVSNFNKENLRLCKFLEIDEKFILRKNCLFKLEESKKNIGKSKKNLTKSEYNLIKSKLSEHLRW
ncbi:sulfotransferase [Candidatus Pelagibacter sp.]|jgi:hypothetical protein|nr:sulfotransferase [Candidatus Pelagibacter sp.]